MSKRNFRLIRLAMLAASAAAVVPMTPATAQAQARSFDISAQPLGPALLEFSRQSDVMILVAPELTAGRRSSTVRGNLPVNEAIARLLRGTGLRAVPNASGGYRIEGPAAANPQGEPLAGSADIQDESAEQAIVVIGTNIRGLRNRTAPVITLDREYIESTGYGTTTALIESLPQNFALANQATPPSFPGVTGDRSQGAAINLRGIGEGTTLVLLDGRRLALGFDGTSVDISTLPLSAIERVEILTDGASALYGADAVGGVVNFVLRRDFEGVETRARAGWAPGGVNEYRASAVGGASWDSGSILALGEYYHRDLLPAGERDYIPAAATIQSLLPRDDNLSFLVNLRQEVASTLTVFAQGLYTNRDTFNRGGRFTAQFAEDSESSIDQLTFGGGLEWRLGHGWGIELAGGYGRYDRSSTRGGFIGGGRSDSEGVFESWSGEAKADGPLFELPGGPVRAAVGGNWRSESFNLVNSQSGFTLLTIDEDQRVIGVFGEINVPLFGSPNAQPGLRRLELSLALRYDDYSNFGGSLDPRIGVAWEPTAGLLLRGSYGTSYVAPKLSDYDTSVTAAAALFFLDPGVPGGVSYQLQVLGGADVPSLRAQESRNLTFGLELAPPSVPGLRFALGYYDIRYENQIALPPQSTTVLLGNPDAFGSLFIRNPTVEQVQQYVAIGQAGQGFFAFDAFFQFDPNFDPATVEVIIDGRRRNLALVNTRGLDFSASYDFTAQGSDFHLGLDGVYIFDRTQQVTPTSAPFETIDTVFNPPELRLRGSGGWRRGGWAVNAFLNHVNSYTDNRLMPFVSVDSWTTIDANLSYRFGEGRGALSGLAIVLSATNLFNADPPFVRINGPFEIGFDPANASPLGRLVALEIIKRW